LLEQERCEFITEDKQREGEAVLRVVTVFALNFKWFLRKMTM